LIHQTNQFQLLELSKTTESVAAEGHVRLRRDRLQSVGVAQKCSELLEES
jgi:hypothetical protein